MDLLLLLVLLSFVSGDASPGRCSLSPTLYRNPDLVVVLGRAAGVSATTGRGPAEKLRFLRLAAGDRATSEATVAAATDSTIWLVPWGHDATCRRVAWEGAQKWLPQDSVGVYELFLVPKEFWPEGKPTFDAYTAGLQPFPQRNHGYDKRPSHAALTAPDYFEFLLALPTYPPGQISTLPPSLQRWVKDHQDLRDRYPVPETLQFWARPQ
jgi:hypothetical protein